MNSTVSPIRSTLEQRNQVAWFPPSVYSHSRLSSTRRTHTRFNAFVDAYCGESKKNMHTISLTKLSSHLVVSKDEEASYRPSRRPGFVHSIGSDGLYTFRTSEKPIILGSHVSIAQEAWATTSQRKTDDPPSCSSVRIRLSSSAKDQCVQPSIEGHDLLPMPSVSPTSSHSNISLIPRTSSYIVSRCSDARMFWLGLYFALNLALTLYNKLVLVSFPFPYTLTALHTLACTVGGKLLLQHGFYRPQSVSMADHAVLVFFSILYSVNIAVSNVSLQLVTVPVSNGLVSLLSLA